MPELPEVETVKNTLKKQIIGKKIKKVDVLYNGIIATNLKEFKKILLIKNLLILKEWVNT